jgi:hypothetical protein
MEITFDKNESQRARLKTCPHHSTTKSLTDLKEVT